jgi:uncharacterized protein YndB with AHSA1/START domain
MPTLRHSLSFSVIGAALLATMPMHAAVADSAANGFTVKLEFNIQAPPQKVYRQLVHDVGDWWNSMHSFSGDAHNLSIDDKAMGCFCEKLPSGGSVKHLEVVYADPGKKLVFSGALGPLQSIAATGSLIIQLSAAGDGTKLSVDYTVTGYMAAGMNTWAAPVDSVLNEQFTRLKSLVETGKAETGKAGPR